MGTLLILLSHLFSIAAAQSSGFLAPAFKSNKIVFVGENHLIAEHKLHFQTFVQQLALDGALERTAIAIEFVERNDSTALLQYLADPQALRGSALEERYFGRLHRRLSLASNLAYDDLMRTLKSTFQASAGKLRICAINVAEIYGSFNDTTALEKLTRLQQLPQALQLEIQAVQRLSLEELSHTNLGWDREGALAVGVADCAKDRDRTLVLIGANHGLKYPADYPARSAAQLVSLISPQTVATVKFLQPFNSPLF
jgi:Haem-binding uptake, Tiki superfamily, ChaN